MLQRTAVLRTANLNHGSLCNGTSNGPIAHAQSEKKKMEVMTVLLEALLECCTLTILCKILPMRLLITNTKDSRHEFYFQLFLFVSNLSATINTIMKVKGRPFFSLFLWQHQKVSCIVWFAHIFVAREVDINYLSSRWFITSIQFSYNFSCGCNG